MKYKITLTYNDDKSVALTMQEEDVERFLKGLREGEFYKNETSGFGFWTPMDQIRHVIIEKVKEEEISVEGEESGSEQ